MSHLRGYLTFHICSSIKKTSDQAEAAQKLRGVWVIVVRSDNTQSSLLQDGYLSIKESRIALYGDNPFLCANREDTEIIKNSCLGCDGIPATIVKRTIHLYIKILTLIINQIFYNGVFRRNLKWPKSYQFINQDQ